MKDITQGTKDSLLLASVFITGAAVLVVEIIATRILSPYYGNTIYTTSSVIGTVLAALSLGYYLGGMLSDKYPEERLFYGIILISGFLIIFINVLDSTFLQFLSNFFSISYGPVISSVFLFFIPSFTLGMLSPFAIKLYQKSSANEIGGHSGKVLFWSTLGSIIGSFLSGFVLIPNLGVNNIIIGTGFLLVLWSFALLLLLKKLNKEIMLFVLILIVSLLLLFLFINNKDDHRFIYEKDGVYEKIRIEDRVWQGHPTRFLYQDKSWSSAMFLDSDEMAFDYTKYYKLYELFNKNPKKIFVIGGAAYSIPKAILSRSKETNVLVSEIEPEYYDLAKKYFNLKDDPRLQNFIEDGRRLLAKNENQYDAIISDVYYSIFSMPIHFTTKEFFSLSKNHLLENGAFIGNFAGSLDPKTESFILSEIKTFKEVFPNSYFFAVNNADSSVPQNIIFLGINSDKKIDFNNKDIKNSKDPIFANLSEKNINIDQFDLSSYQEITDDFSPIEYLVSRDIKKFY